MIFVSTIEFAVRSLHPDEDIVPAEDNWLIRS